MSTRPSTASESCCLASTRESSRSGPTSARCPVHAASASSDTESASGTSSRDRGCPVTAARGTGPAALDLVPELDERQLAASDLLAQPLPLLRVLDLHELVRVGQRVFAQGHQLADVVGSIRKSQPVFEVALVLAELLGELPDRVAVFPDHAVVHRRFVERGEVLALEVLDDRDLEGRVVVDVFDERRDRREGRPSWWRASGARRRSADSRCCRAGGRGSVAGRRARGSTRQALRGTLRRRRGGAAVDSARSGRSG